MKRPCMMLLHVQMKRSKKGEQVDLNRLQSFAEATVDMVATKWRASYFKEASKGYMDPGAQSMVYILHAIIGDEA